MRTSLGPEEHTISFTEGLLLPPSSSSSSGSLVMVVINCPPVMFTRLGALFCTRQYVCHSVQEQAHLWIIPKKWMVESKHLSLGWILLKLPLFSAHFKSPNNFYSCSHDFLPPAAKSRRDGPSNSASYSEGRAEVWGATHLGTPHLPSQGPAGPALTASAEPEGLPAWGAGVGASVDSVFSNAKGEAALDSPLGGR